MGMQPSIGVGGLLLIAALTQDIGCSTMGSQTPSYVTLEPGKAYWFRYGAEDRGALLYPVKVDPEKQVQKVAMCAEPAPDVGLQKQIQSLSNISAKLPMAGEPTGQLQYASSVQTELLQLAGRTQTILFLREAMYRLCEQELNGDLPASTAHRLYETVVATSITLAQTQLLEALAKVADKNSNLSADLMGQFLNAQLIQALLRDLDPEDRISYVSRLRSEGLLPIQSPGFYPNADQGEMKATTVPK
jgi:hypothetical protein